MVPRFAFVLYLGRVFLFYGVCMDKLILRELTIEDKEEVLEYLKEFTEYGSAMNGIGGASSSVSYEDMLEKQKLKKEIPFTSYEQEEYPGITYLIIRENDNKIIGSVNIRWNLTKALDENFGGNIGYGIRPTERRKGYATESLRLALNICREKGMKFVRLGCYTNNIGSRKTILKNGGRLINHKEKLIPEDYYEITL